MRHSADLGGVSCSLYLLVESVRVPGQPLQPQCSVYTSLLIRSHLLSQENQHNHHKCIEGLLFHVDFQLRARAHHKCIESFHVVDLQLSLLFKGTMQNYVQL